MVTRANQLKKAREDFFLGKEPSPSRPQSLPLKSEIMAHLKESPTFEKVLISNTITLRPRYRYFSESQTGNGREK